MVERYNPKIICERSSIPNNLNNTQILKKKVPNQQQLFNYSNKTNQPRTLLLRNANKYVEKVWEGTKSHYDFLKKLGKNNADYYINSAWCALTISILANESTMDIGEDFIPTVDGFISWAGRRYHKIQTNKLTASNVKQERQRRAGEILKQIRSGKMKEGDFIIWKSDIALKDGQNWNIKQASHIGIIESVDKEKGTITVIEGNANITKTSGGEALIVKNKKEGIKGNQEIGEVQEINPKDGIIRKTYTVEELARNGYSGYIDNAGFVK